MNPRTIVIEPVLNGFIVQVGCQRVVVKNVGELSGEIARYYSNPLETERAYVAQAVNKTMDGPCTVADRPRPIRQQMTDPVNQECCEAPKCPEPTSPSRY